MLKVRNLRAGYGGASVLHGVDCDLGAGEIVSIVGRNGSGRSTLLKALVGIVPVTDGTVQFQGRELAGLRPYRIVRAGLSYVPEERLVFHNLSVRDNMVLGGQKRRGSAATWQAADFHTLFPNLLARMNTKAGVLSGGEQQMLTICRSLLGNPDAILIDEPTEGLAPRIVDTVVQLILEMKRRKIGVVLVEQKLTVALEISDRVYVMGHGRLVFEGTPAELRSNVDVRKRWLEV